MPSTGEDGPVRLREDDTGARFLIFVTDKGIRHELRYDGDQPWFTQKQLADMFGVAIPTVNEHIQKFVGDGELAASTIRDFRIVRSEGARQVERDVNPDAIDRMCPSRVVSVYHLPISNMRASLTIKGHDSSIRDICMLGHKRI